MATKFEELEKLAKLKEQWFLSDEEFEIEKKKILWQSSENIENQEWIVIWNIDMIHLKNPITWKIIECPTGFSWTSLIFWFWVPLLRGDFLWFFLYLIISFITFGIFCFIFPFIYNSLFIRSHLKSGHTPSDINSRNYLKSNWYIL